MLLLYKTHWTLQMKADRGSGFQEGKDNRIKSRKQGSRQKVAHAGNRSYLHEVGRVAGWGDPPLGGTFPL